MCEQGGGVTDDPESTTRDAADRAPDREVEA